MTSPDPADTPHAPAPDPRLRVLAVVGPTGVGKTALAEELAVRLGGEIVSADSMQVYCGMDIGTAKPPVEERRVPYHCLDLVGPGEPFSAALYQRAARGAIADIAARGRLPIVTGGTGLYVRAALDAMEFPPGELAENPARQRYEAYARDHGADALWERLRDRDPASAVLVHAKNVRRVVRALEMLDDGTSYAEQAAGFSRRESVFDARFLGLTMERAHLYARIDRRVDEMVAAGLLGEVERLLGAGFRDALTAAQAIGYKELVPVVVEGADLESALDAVKQASRRYAKRQLTWFRADPRVCWVDMTDVGPRAGADVAMGTLDWSSP